MPAGKCGALGSRSAPDAYRVNVALIRHRRCQHRAGLALASATYPNNFSNSVSSLGGGGMCSMALELGVKPKLV